MHILLRGVVLLGVVAAVGIASPRGMAATPTDACPLLTPQQVGDAVGAKMGEGVYVTPEFKKTCTWTAPGIIVTLYLESTAMFQAGKGAALPSKVTPVSGLGDDAYYLIVGDMASLFVKNGSAAFKVTVYSSKLPLEKRQKMEETLARQVLTKL